MVVTTMYNKPTKLDMDIVEGWPTQDSSFIEIET